MLIEGKYCTLETDDPVKDQNIVNYVDYIYNSPEFKEKLKKSMEHYIDTGEIKYVH